MRRAKAKRLGLPVGYKKKWGVTYGEAMAYVMGKPLTERQQKAKDKDKK